MQVRLFVCTKSALPEPRPEAKLQVDETSSRLRETHRGIAGQARGTEKTSGNPFAGGQFRGRSQFNREKARRNQAPNLFEPQRLGPHQNCAPYQAAFYP